MKTIITLFSLLLAASGFSAYITPSAGGTNGGGGGTTYVTNIYNGETLWTNISGIYKPTSTNAVKIYPNGGLFLGKNATNLLSSFNGSDLLGAWFDVSAGEPARTTFTFGASDSFIPGGGSFTNYAYAQFEADAGEGGSGFLYFYLKGGSNSDGDNALQFSTIVGDGYAALALENNLVTLLYMEPTAAADATPYVFDTVIPHTTGRLVEFKNARTNVVLITPNGSVTAYGSYRNVPSTLAYSTTHVWVDCSLNNYFNLTATNNFTLHLTNVLAGWAGIVNVRQDATGSRLMALDSFNIKTNASVELSTTAGIMDVLYLSSDDRGTNVHMILQPSFQ